MTIEEIEMEFRKVWDYYEENGADEVMSDFCEKYVEKLISVAKLLKEEIEFIDTVSIGYYRMKETLNDLEKDE